MPTGSLQARNEVSGLSGVTPSGGRSLHDCGAYETPDERLTLGAMLALSDEKKLLKDTRMPQGRHGRGWHCDSGAKAPPM
jgi:hypothetical protein